ERMSLISALRKLTHVHHADRAPQTARPAARPDGFDRSRRGPSAAQLERDRSFVTGLYRELLGREPDVEGMAAHMRGLAGGMRHEDILHVFVTSPEYKERLAAQNAPVTPEPAPPPATPSPPPPPALPPEPGAPLSTVPMRAEYANAPIDKSSPAAAAKSAAAW